MRLLCICAGMCCSLFKLCWCLLVWPAGKLKPQADILKRFISMTTPLQMRWLVQIVLKNLRVSVAPCRESFSTGWCFEELVPYHVEVVQAGSWHECIRVGVLGTGQAGLIGSPDARSQGTVMDRC